MMFASLTADLRGALGQLGTELDVGINAPLYQRWWENSFCRNHPAATIKPYYDELTMLVTALDEFHAGRMVEVGDILSSRLRMLTAGIEKGSFKLSRHFLVYHTRDLGLCSESMFDEAVRIEKRASKRDRELAALRGGARDR